MIRRNGIQTLTILTMAGALTAVLGAGCSRSLPTAAVSPEGQVNPAVQAALAMKAGGIRLNAATSGTGAPTGETGAIPGEAGATTQTGTPKNPEHLPTYKAKVHIRTVKALGVAVAGRPSEIRIEGDLPNITDRLAEVYVRTDSSKRQIDVTAIVDRQAISLPMLGHFSTTAAFTPEKAGTYAIHVSDGVPLATIKVMPSDGF